jgi:predicted aldo/keto reductase-like oxidoreductase
VGLFRHCYDRGINFFDLADWYGSHPYCREALRHIPRENGAMQTAAGLPWVDIMLARLNPFGVMCDSTPDDVRILLAKAKSNGKGIIGMKIYGEGKLVDKREECMEYAQSNGVFDAMTIGAVSPEQVDENLRLMAKFPVTKA